MAAAPAELKQAERMPVSEILPWHGRALLPPKHFPTSG
uniref:Uncharacterized protein n=1 Tax=Tetraselmis sp. GSL018 TaxID=582737 RepID=A0A061QY78_9CHLO